MGFMMINKPVVAYLLLSLVLISAPSFAVDSIVVLGLFKNKVMVKIDGKQRLLVQNLQSPEGVTLISSDSNSAILELNGKQERYLLGRQISTNFTAPKMATEVLYRDEIGMYNAQGTINGLPVSFLVDTGATFVAMNRHQAKRLNIDYLVSGNPSFVSTASGVERAYNIKLNKVTVGTIALTNVDAVVLDGDSPTQVLLGMSFLGQLEMSNKGQLLQLKKKF